jgi:thiamine kinase
MSPLSKLELSDQERFRLEGVLSEWRYWTTESPVFIKSLSDGLTNKSFLLEAAGQSFVLRLNAPESDQLALDRVAEAQVLNQAAGASIAPTLVYSDPAQRFLITEYIRGTQWSSQQSKSPQGINRLAKLLRTIHRLRPISSYLSLADRADHYGQNIDNNNDLVRQLKKLQPAVKRHMDLMEASNTHPCLCHNDLLSENLIDGDNSCLYALDWEYAAMGDPYFDLAVIAEGHGLDETECQQFLTAYHGGSASSSEVSRLYHSRVIYSYMSLLWYCVKFPQPAQSSMKDTLNEKLVSFETLLTGDS